MAPDFIFIRCLYCARVYRTTAGIDHERLAILLPVLKLVSAKCPHCGQISRIGAAEICWSGQRAA